MMVDDAARDLHVHVRVGFFENVLKSYASIVDAHLVYLDYLLLLTKIVESGDTPASVRFAAVLAEYASASREELQKAAAQCADWQKFLDDNKPFYQALADRGLTLDDTSTLM